MKNVKYAVYLQIGVDLNGLFVKCFHHQQVRPSVKQFNNQRSEDDITHKLIDILEDK